MDSYSLVMVLGYIIALIVGLALTILSGYLWNYFVIKELKVLNGSLEKMSKILSHNLSLIAEPENQKTYNNVSSTEIGGDFDDKQ